MERTRFKPGRQTASGGQPERRRSGDGVNAGILSLIKDSWWGDSLIGGVGCRLCRRDRSVKTIHYIFVFTGFVHCVYSLSAFIVSIYYLLYL